MKKKLTTKEFVDRAMKIHKDLYNYDKTIYYGFSKKVLISCPEHGDFTQRVFAHLNGQGCPKCFRKRCSERMSFSIEDFMEKAIKIHGSMYSYSKSVYVNSGKKITIICPQHGAFFQTPAAHLTGQGCPQCGKLNGDAKQKRLSQEEFINRSRAIHGNKYDYSQALYIQAFQKVLIKCPFHGFFYQYPFGHFTGQGCPRCGTLSANQKNTSTRDEFVRKALSIHKGKYDYFKTIYVNARSKVSIRCPKHGEFTQTPAAHLSGQGCPSCNKSKGEMRIEDWLILHGIQYISQAKFPECKGRKRLLPFDFYLPYQDTCIECDGPQHYDRSFIKFARTFDQTQISDQIKNDFCKQKHHKLVRIRYSDAIKKELLNRTLSEITGIK